MVRYQCFVQKVPEQVVNSMRRFPDDETLQETCLEALAVLAAAGNAMQYKGLSLACGFYRKSCPKGHSLALRGWQSDAKR